MSAKKTPLQPTLIDRVHSANLANIMRKVQEKKTLTAVEVKQINDAKRAEAEKQKTDYRELIADGIVIMEKIKSIIDNSSLAVAEKRRIALMIEGLCTPE